MRFNSKLFDWPRLLGRFYRSGRCISWVMKFKRCWTVNARFTHRFSLSCLTFGSCSKRHDLCNIHLKSESTTGQLRNQSSRQNFREVLGLFFFFFLENESVCEYYSRTLLANIAHVNCSFSIKLRTGFREWRHWGFRACCQRRTLLSSIAHVDCSFFIILSAGFWEWRHWRFRECCQRRTWPRGSRSHLDLECDVTLRGFFFFREKYSLWRSDWLKCAVIGSRGTSIHVLYTMNMWRGGWLAGWLTCSLAA